MQVEKRLLQHILTKSSPFVRPVKDRRTPTNVTFGFEIKQIPSIVESQQTIKVPFSLTFDHRGGRLPHRSARLRDWPFFLRECVKTKKYLRDRVFGYPPAHRALKAHISEQVLFRKGSFSAISLSLGE